ncbi:uncharacterized protein PGTG_04291 [Puccinia graminis f. sp. tritici CRL 75-36-700-3]|uniref:NADP-dependent oxidoreductase domain-containing protein n=2 Tax=Puccinia graminis f. sp. tritici TaxID=56615 RepID=E3K1W6_PUCGT|nr:uncharacterized protein PGTG_04291 [Puccinia graminis f. sp. tritici CRL 75-36-700-3]EFP78335.2 hypothetical protein PGTG_04291 [Puccinia graminis f. sp. tritici CRL 75-36-700-3]
MFSYNRNTVRQLSLFIMIFDQTTSAMTPVNSLVTEAAATPQVFGEGLLKGLNHGADSRSIMPPPKYQIKDMKFNQLGHWGLRVPIFSYGGALSVGSVATGAAVKELLQIAWDHGCNYFDTAEGYANGKSETELGKALKELGWERSEFMVATKIFFGTGTSQEPNARGLSRKHIIEGLMASLKRLQLRYVDVVHAHRPDPTVPIFETVWAFDYLVRNGHALYWGTSEWSAQQIQEAVTVAGTNLLIPPMVEQPQYSLLHRERFEVEYEPIFKNLGYGSTIWSPLKGGLLTGKYNDGIPAGSRLEVNKEYLKHLVAGLQTEEGRLEIEKVKKLTQLAEDKLGCTVGQLALAWAASNKRVSTVILGATKPEQLRENFGALKIIDKLTPEIKEEIEAIVDNAPTHPSTWGR